MFVIEDLVKELALRLMEERGLSMKLALDAIIIQILIRRFRIYVRGCIRKVQPNVYGFWENEILIGKLG